MYLSVCDVYQTESLVPNGSIQICVLLHPYVKKFCTVNVQLLHKVVSSEY